MVERLQGKSLSVEIACSKDSDTLVANLAQLGLAAHTLSQNVVNAAGSFRTETVAPSGAKVTIGCLARLEKSAFVRGDGFGG